MTQSFYQQLETPCLVIDVLQVKKNLLAMQAATAACGCSLRPHIKTHKMPLFAKMQLQYGAQGITCAKVSEAEVMAAAGIDDIFIAYPMVGAFRIKRALRLAKQIRRLILAVDSVAGAESLNQAAAAAGVLIEVRLEVDTGAGRTGVRQTEAVALAKMLSQMSHLQLTGIYTFKGLVYQGQPSVERELAAQEEAALMAQVAKELHHAGIPITEISAGSTPTGLLTAATGKVSEIRPGTYIFNDYMLYREGAAKIEEMAVRMYATVVSTPCPEYAVIDAGTKTVPMDIGLTEPPYYYPGYAIVADHPDLELRRMNEEHGILMSRQGETGLQVGDLIELYPLHICTAINMQNYVWLYDGNSLTSEPVAARGMLI